MLDKFVKVTGTGIDGDTFTAGHKEALVLKSSLDSTCKFTLVNFNVDIVNTDITFTKS